MRNDKPSASGRRTFLRGGAAAVGITATGLGATAVARPQATPVSSFAVGRPVLFRGATVVTGDPKLGVRKENDVLVEGSVIRAVGRRLAAPGDAFVIDARDSILMPGMIDTHRHMWQTMLRGLGAEWTMQNYMQWM